ncbi:MAG: hypothetical protein HZC54_13170 [Verrucomicrobia bacterium]|nr:hypothetical protein [Verrucomicrobiota bacterium]
MNKSRFHSLAVVILIVAGALLYGHTLSFPFVFDDHIYLVDNPLVKDGHSFVFNGDFVAFATLSKRLGLDPDISTNMILRPVTYLTFYINYVVGGMNPRGFRAVNIAIHCANAVLLFLVLLHLLSGSRKSGSLTAASEGFIAFLAALLFLVHPLQTESVTYIVQRFTSLSAFFFLATILAYLIAYSAASKLTAAFFRWTSIAGLIVGMLTKESLFAVPFVLVVLDWLVMGIPLKIVLRRTIPYFLCLPIIPALILATSWAQHSGNASVAAALNITNPYADPNYQYHYALTQLSAVLSYLQLILVPAGLNLDWEYPLSKSLMQMRVIGSVMTIAGIVGGAWFWYYRRQEDARRSLFFASVLCYFVTLADSSSVIPLPDLMVEHRCYIATIGALTALACCVDLLRTWCAERHAARWLVPACAGVWILALMAATVARNEVWRSEIANWTDAAAKSPKKFRPLMNLGVAYVEHGKPKEGMACFRKALQIEPSLIGGYENLATMENTTGNFAEALLVSQVGLKYAPQSCKLHFNKAVAYNGLGQTEKSIEWFKKAIALSPTHKQSHLALGVIYTNLKQYDDALKHYKIAASLPTFREFDSQLRFNIAQIERLVQERAGPPMAMSRP